MTFSRLKVKEDPIVHVLVIGEIEANNLLPHHNTIIDTHNSTIVSSEQDLIQVRSSFAFDQFIQSFIFYNIFFSYGLHVLLFMSNV